MSLPIDLAGSVDLGFSWLNLPWLRLAGAWSLTYLAHSSLLLAFAWLAGRLLAGRSPRAEEALWRVALLAGFATASLQVAWPAVSERWEANRTAARPRVEVVDLASAPARGAALGVQLSPVAATPGRIPLRLPASLAAGAAGTWAVAALLGSLLLALAALGLRRRLRGRREVDDARVRRDLAELVEATGERSVRLTETGSLTVPIALGVMRREICLPRRVLSALGERERRALLAHELAHHARRDPLWLLVLRFAEALGAVQPLNRFARRRLVELSEWLSDARAVQWTGDPEGLARCLAEVASWHTPAAPTRLVPGLSAGGNRLVDRVRRLLAGDSRESGPWVVRWTRACGGMAAVAVVAFLPGLGPASFADPVQTVGASPVAPVAVASSDSVGDVAEPTPARAETAPTQAPEADEQFTVDGKRWEELTPAERARVRREVRQAREGMREAVREATRAVEEARRHLPEREELERAVAEAHRAAEEAMRAAELAAGPLRSAIEVREMRRLATREIEVSRRELEAAREQLRELGERSHAEMERAFAEAREQMPSEEEMARLHEELERAMREVRPAMEAARQEQVERLSAEMERIQREIEPQLRELDRLGAEIARELGEVLPSPPEALEPPAPREPATPAVAPVPLAPPAPPVPPAAHAPHAPRAREPRTPPPALPVPPADAPPPPPPPPSGAVR